jgi:hypothetical protein
LGGRQEVAEKMAVTVKIGGGEERVLSDVTERWIIDQITRRRQDRVEVCVLVKIEMAGINLRLTTPACSSAGGGGRPPNNREQEIINLWNERKLNSDDFTGGNVIAFLQQLRRLI